MMLKIIIHFHHFGHLSSDARHSNIANKNQMEIQRQNRKDHFYYLKMIFFANGSAELIFSSKNTLIFEGLFLTS